MSSCICLLQIAAVLGVSLTVLAGQPLIIAHRGASWDYPENTILSMTQGFEQGADGGELDVLATADGVPILMHDYTLKRTVGLEHGPIRYTWQELKDRDAGSWKSPRYAGETVPTLADALATVPPGRKMYIEIRSPDHVPACIKAIEQSGLNDDQVVIISWTFATVANIEKLRPNWESYWILALNEKSDMDQIIQDSVDVGLDGLNLLANDWVTEELVARMREAGLAFHVWTVNDWPTAKRMIDLGVESITTDRPGWLREQIQTGGRYIPPTEARDEPLVWLDFENKLTSRGIESDISAVMVDRHDGRHVFRPGAGSDTALEILADDPGTTREGDAVEIMMPIPPVGTIAFDVFLPQAALYNHNTLLDNAANPNIWEIWGSQDGRLIFRIIGGDTVWADLKKVVGSGQQITDRWYNIALTWQRNPEQPETAHVRMFINGKLQQDAGRPEVKEARWSDSGNAMYLGGGHKGNTSGHASFDNLRIYERVLGQDEIEQLASAIDTDENKRERLIKQAEALWRAGETLPENFSRYFAHEPQKLGAADTGINVLIDNAHQTLFVGMWTLPHQTRQLGFRAVGNHASLHEVLTPGNLVRSRLPIGGYRPFAWWPVPEWNVVVTYQFSNKFQAYTPEEQQALEQWIRDGGGLVVITGAAAPDGSPWSLHEMLQRWGATITSESKPVPNQAYQGHVLELTDAWQALTRDQDHVFSARRKLGRGRVVILENMDAVLYPHQSQEQDRIARQRNLREAIEWAAAGKDPVGGEPRLPISGGGAGGIAPELEQHLGNLVVYYAANQTPQLLETYTTLLKDAKGELYKWLPTPPHDQPMYIIAAAGDGGGWAVNAFEPRENGVISMSPWGIVSIFGHELAHTMRGPLGATGIHAAYSPHDNSGEAHAGWFQGKTDAWLRPDLRDKPNRDANWILKREDDAGRMLDLKTEFQNKALMDNWGKATDWRKLWYIWQKLDDRYGPTWYPRWYYVRSTRWADEPNRRLTWEETIEDMSIAVGEDLFPFFIELGTSLDRPTIGTIEFQGEVLALKPAPLQRTPAGPVRLEPAGDYRKPIAPLTTAAP